jgi:hypothetical protein
MAALGTALGAAGADVFGLPLIRRALAADDVAQTSASDVFVAENVPVDVTAATVTDARDRGLIQGRINGLHKVLERLVAKDDLGRLPALTSNQVIEMVRDFSIANERSSAVRYIADLTVRFDPNAVRRLLRNAGIPFAETVSKPLVVIPVMNDGGRTLLWEDANAWRVTWTRVTLDRGLVPLIVPAGDSKDAAAMTAAQALAKDVAAVRDIAGAYDAGGALIAVATPAGGAIQLALTEVRPGLSNQEYTLSQGPEGADDALTAAARAAAVAVQESWRQRNRIAFGTSGQVTALVPISTLKDWLAVRDRLNSVALIERTDLQAITRDRVQVTLYFIGQQDQLRLALAQHDLTLAQQGGVWIISHGGAPRTGQ